MSTLLSTSLSSLRGADIPAALGLRSFCERGLQSVLPAPSRLALAELIGEEPAASRNSRVVGAAIAAACSVGFARFWLQWRRRQPGRRVPAGPAGPGPYTCRICLETEDDVGALIQPCSCTGTQVSRLCALTPPPVQHQGRAK